MCALHLHIAIRCVIGIFFCLFVFISTSTSSAEDLTGSIQTDLALVREVFALPEEQIDLAVAKLRVDRLLDSTIDVAANLREIERIVTKIRNVPRFDETTEGRLNGIIQFLYIAGNWNQNKPYRYDFTDPLGTEKPENALLSNYVKTRKGNCVSMPILVLVVGEKLGLDVSLVVAPMHLFVRLNDNGYHYNIEATAGGLKADDSYKKEFLITAEAVKNGVYLRNLSKKEAVAVMLTNVAHHFSTRSHDNVDFNMAFALTELILKRRSCKHLQEWIWNGIIINTLQVITSIEGGTVSMRRTCGHKGLR